MKIRLLAIASSTLALAACVGTIGDRNDGALPGEDAPGSDPASCHEGTGEAPLRRLTREEYNNTVAALLGDTTRPADGFLEDERHGPFRTNLGAVSDIAVAQYAEAAQRLAEVAVAERLDELSPCGTAPSDVATCLRQFVEEFGLRALRRPLTSDEIAAYLSLAEWQLARADFTSSVALTIETMLQSVHFLYHVAETSDESGQLSPWSTAARLSFAVVRSAPDEDLLEAAALGKLEDPADVEAQVRRMLDTPAGRDTLVSFHAQLLGLEEIQDLAGAGVTDQDYPGETLASMRHETEAFVDHVLSESGSLEELFTASYTFADAEIAALYALIAPANDWERVELDPAQRAGILTQPSLMALQRSPVRRGLFVDETLLCAIIDPPPSNVDTTPPAPVEGVPPREQWLAHVEDPMCAGCHGLLDPIGFAFDHYDAYGRWQDEKGGFPVDASGTVELLAGAPPFQDAVELADVLVRSVELRRCLTRRWLEFALGRPKLSADACFEEEALARLDASGLDVRELFVAIVSSPRFRRVAKGEP